MVKLRKNKVYFFLNLDLNKRKYKNQLITPLVLFHSITNTLGQTVEKTKDTYLDERSSYKLLEQYFPLNQGNHDQINNLAN